MLQHSRRLFVWASAAVLVACTGVPTRVAPGPAVAPGRWGLEQLAVGVPKGREVAGTYLKNFVADAATQALVQQAAQRAGLRGLAAP